MNGFTLIKNIIISIFLYSGIEMRGIQLNEWDEPQKMEQTGNNDDIYLF